MKLKLCFVLSSIAFLVACRTTPSEIPSPSSVEQRTIQVATPASLPSPEPTAASPPTEVPIDLPTQAPTAEATDMPSDPLQVPSGNPPTIDGTHSPSEWDAAAVETFVDGSQLLLMQAGDYLYLGIRANVSGTVVGNVYVLHGDEVAVLHSSAALGTAIYEKGEESWQQIQDFDWCCRTAGTSESAQAERAAFLQEEGWLAANGRMGTPNELEYQIKPAEPNVRLAVVYTGPTPPYEKVPWPVHVDDDTILPTPGGLPAFLHFSPEQWATLSIPALAPTETKSTAPGMLAFTSARDVNMEIYLMDVDGIPAWRPEIASALPP